ncbi:MAG: hypothetical protein K2M87_05315 [Muribaculaceae bacterium]|nr:hypothetical protein [Muribaculaceae bacterium]
MRIFRGFVIITLLIVCTLQAISETSTPIVNEGLAREWCDTHIIANPEGIWEYPSDETKVLIRQSDISRYRYDIVVIDTPDTRIMPGQIIGYLQSTADPGQFEMLVSRTGALGKSDMSKCAAKLSRGGNTMAVKGRKIKFSLNTRWLLSNFWRALRVDFKDPLDDLPCGLIRIYPQPDTKGPDYL